MYGLRIIHGHDTINDATVCGVLDSHLPAPLGEVEALLQKPDADLQDPLFETRSRESRGSV